MSTEDLLKTESEVSKRYFGSFADDYHRAFEGTGRNPIHRLINAAFRRKTFSRRTDLVAGWLRELNVQGKQVLDVGCGSGEVSLVAAGLGATVTGIDIVPDMISIARAGADAAGHGARCTFRVGNIATDPLEAADVTMMIGVIEYYRDIDRLLPRIAASTREALIIVDTRGPWWRRTLRYALARFKHFHLYYHRPDVVSGIVTACGFSETARVPGHSYTAFLFKRNR